MKPSDLVLPRPVARRTSFWGALRALVAAALLTFGIGSGADAATPDQWRRDLDQMSERIRDLHPHPWKEVGRVTFLREIEALKAELPSLTEEQRVVRAMRIVASLHDQATSLDVNNPSFSLWYPIRIQEFTDGYFVTTAHKTVADLAGAQLLEIAGRPVTEVVNDARSLQSSYGPMQRKERLFAVLNAALMRGMGYAHADGSLPVKLKLPNGKVVRRALPAMSGDSPIFGKGSSSFAFADATELLGTPVGGFDDWITAYHHLPYSAYRTEDTLRPLHLSLRRSFHTVPLPAQNAYYVQINDVSGTRAEPFNVAIVRMLREVDAAKPKRLILDLRQNYGGDGSKAVPMIHEFIKREDSRPWQELYVLTSPRTAGAAISVVGLLLQNVPVTLVGEPTGTPLNSSSDANSFAFPDIGMRLSVTVRTGQLGESDDLSTSVPVDVPAPFSFADYVAGRDPAVDPILRGDEMRSLTAIALADGGGAARRAYEARKALSSRYPWWSKPRFEDVKRLGYTLLRADRALDAVQIFGLLTELYPDSWNSWESMGRAQAAGKLLAQARESYRCALALDRENFDAADLRQALLEAPTETQLPTGCPARVG
jgi:hypothetical protein